MITYQHQKASKPILDKLALTFDVEPEIRKQVKSYLLNRLHESGVYQVHAKGYELSLNIPLGYGVKLFIQVGNQIPDRPYGRFEFNPSKVIEEDTLPCLESELTCLCDSTYEEWMSVHHVSRVDVAIDLEHVNINDLLITAPNYVRTGMWCSKGGRTETLYLGSEQSPGRFIAYNKRAELLKHGHKDIGHDLTRLEFRLRKTGLTVSGLLSIPNPFQDVRIYSLRACEKLGEKSCDLEWWSMFYDSSAYRGLHAALLKLPPQKRSKVKKAMEAGLLKCWKPWNIWKGWPSAIKPLLSI